MLCCIAISHRLELFAVVTDHCSGDPLPLQNSVILPHSTGTSEIVQQLKVFPHHSEAYLLTIFLINTLFGPIFFILLLSSMFSLTLLIACTISVVPCTMAVVECSFVIVCYGCILVRQLWLFIV